MPVRPSPRIRRCVAASLVTAALVALACGAETNRSASGGRGGDPAATGGHSGTGATGGTASGGSATGGQAGAGAATSQGGALTGGTTGGRGGVGGSPGAPGGGAGKPGAGGGASTGGTSALCDPGTTTTVWATDCPTSAPPCAAGSWSAGGPDPDHAAFRLVSESAHFAVYSDEAISATTAEAATSHLETVWSLYFGRPFYMREPLCQATSKTKASIHVHSDWGLTGGSWATGRMGMWIGTGGLSDHWGLAHEFMHGVQAVEGGLVCNQSNTCGWIFESHANWAAQQQSEYHTTDVHCSEMLANMPHLYLGSTRDRYCNWQFLEYLKDKHCHSAVNDIWTGTPAPDPFTAVMKSQGWDVATLDDFVGEWALHDVTWDYQDPPPSATAGKNQGALFRRTYGLITDTTQSFRRLRTTKLEPLDADVASHRRFFSPFFWAPQRFGYNVVRLFPEAGASRVTVTFRGVLPGGPSAGWRWGLVATDAALTTARYGALQRSSDGAASLCVSPGESVWLVVAATPTTLQTILWDQPYSTVPRYPYMVQVDGAWPEGFESGKPAACPTGLTRASNGGGCAPAGLAAYVGPYALVLPGASVGANARIEDHAIVARGTVSSGTVGALSIIGNADATFNMTSGTVRTTFYPLGHFETGQGLAGGTLVGDVEYRGQGLTRASGTCSGFVDATTCLEPGTDPTARPPYTWR